MRIISKFRDYYDSVSSFGIDMECIYNRKSELHEFKKITGNTAQKRFPSLSENRKGMNFNTNMGNVQNLEMMVLGFCGKLYPLIKAEIGEGLNTSSYCFYDFDSFDAAMKENDFYFKRNGGGYRLQYYGEFGVRFEIERESSVKEFFNYSFPELNEFFAEYHSPIFLFKRGKDYTNQIETNVRLLDLGFGKIKDPASCFQEIFMYMSGVLGNIEKETVQISDKDMLKQKGFDQYSFKKLPTKKKF